MLEFATALVLMQRFRCKDHVYAYCDGEIAAVLNCFNSEIEINTQYFSTGGNNCNCTSPLMVVDAKRTRPIINNLLCRSLIIIINLFS